jgi:hypothetical protein
VAGVVEEWVEDKPKIGASKELLPELVELIAKRSSITARAEHDLPPDPPARLRDEMQLLLSAVEAALLTGDDAVVVEMLDWQEASLTAHDIDPSQVHQALGEALAEFSEPGRDALSRAVAQRGVA